MNWSTWFHLPFLIRGRLGLPQNGLYGDGYKWQYFIKKGVMLNVLIGKLSKNLIYKEI